MSSWQPLPSALLMQMPKTYALAEIAAQRDAMRARGEDVLDVSLGESHVEPPDQTRDALARAAAEVPFNRYPGPRGSPELRAAFADLYRRRYGAALDPDREVLPLLGSKEAIVNLARAFADCDKPVYSSPVGYPVYRAAAALAGAELCYLGGDWDDGYRPSFVGPPRRGGVAFVSSPANPTSAVLGRDTIERFAAECREREVVLCFDAAYAELSGAGAPALAIPTAGKSGVVEFHSLSKSLSLAGWRVGFAVGDPDIIDGLARVKAFCDAGVPSPQQRALVHLLPVCEELFDHTRLHFADQQRALRAALAPLALELFESDAGMFCWLRPGRPGVEFARACMAAGVVLVPGQVFGPGGADCARISATLPKERMSELAGRLGRILDEGGRG
jgi:aspartate/methionine/tyrosine aminotransferase